MTILRVAIAFAFLPGVGMAQSRTFPQPADVARELQQPVAVASPTPVATPPVAVPAAAVPATPADRGKSLGVGDQVTFQIVEDKDLPVSKRVTDTGELDIPYIGRVQAAGKTCDQVAAEIKRKLEADYYYKATVKLGLDLVNRVAAALGKVYLSGFVRMTGPQELMPGEKTTVSAVIVKAGGGTQFGDLRKVKVTRKTKGGGSETFVVDVKAVIEKGEMDKDRDVRDGDYLYVPQKLLNW